MGQLFKNVASQKVRVFAFADAGHATLDPGEPVTGDAANISAYTAVDNGTLGASNDAAPTEVDATNAPGYYEFDPTQAETNGSVVEWYPKSSTAGVQVVTVGGNVQTTQPQYLPNFNIASDGDFAGNVDGTVASVVGAVGSVTGAVGSVTGNVGGIAGTITTLDALDTAQDSQHSTTQGKVDTAQADLDIITGTAGALIDVGTGTGQLLITAGVIDQVTLVDTTTTNTDMRGTDSAFLAASAPSNFSAMLINASGHVSRVTLVDTTTTNTDMRGTDSAYTGTPPTAATISDAVWDEVQSGHTTPGSFGKYLDTEVSGVSGVTAVDIHGIVTRASSTYYVSFVLRVSGAMVTSGLSSLVCTFYDEDGTDLTFSGTPSESGGFIYATGTLGTALTDNRPLIVKVGATYGGTAYSTVLTAVAVATS